jgi:2-keto-3-deoxy-L-fuconate dehydrogenase
MRIQLKAKSNTRFFMTTPPRLAGKTAFVTAAGQGIGRATALAMADQGAQVIATDVNPDLLSEIQHTNIETLPLDVLKDTDVQAALTDHKPNVLFNCAGFVHHGTILDCTADEWDFAFNLNVRAMFVATQAALPHMLENGGGSIINMSSAVSSIIAAPNRLAYGASKAAVVGLTKSVAKDFVTQSIRCNAICPGTVESPSWHDRVTALGEQLGSYDDAMEQFVSRQPMGRVATANEIANLIVYLASDESAFTTGQTHVIDGGWAS